MNTITTYNHNTLGTPMKPLISNANFKELMKEVKAGNKQVYDEMLKLYSLHPYQHNLIQHELTMQIFKTKY